MVSKTKVLCDSKPKFLVHSFELEDGTPVKVYIAKTKKAVKQYCKDTELPFKDGFRAFYKA